MSEKVCLAICAIDCNKPGFLTSIVSLIQNWDATEENPIVFELKLRKMLHMGQEACVMTALTNRCTHILFVEDDSTHIPDGALRKLLDHDVDVVGAYAYARHWPHYAMIFKKMNPNENKPWLAEEMAGVVLIDPDQGLKEVDMVPYQFTLIKMSVFQKIEAPWFFYDYRADRLTDFWFADKCFEQGIKIHCDTDLIIQHDGIDGNTAGYYVQKGYVPSYGPSMGNWKSASVLPLMREMGMEVHNEASEAARLKQGASE
ncbi:MAG: hypothetical protein JRJ45_09160 [Deltaproteobacteria bacterium]|nr:hypothetical protein [Deltaproteobacteria bacterium]